MGTSNFHSVNAGNTYAVLLNYEQPMYTDTGEETDETETVVCDENDVNDFISNIRSEAERIAKENNLKYHQDLEMTDPHELCSFGSSPLFQIYLEKHFGDVHVEVNINCVMRSGYYEGACLDWFDTTVYGGETESFSDTEYAIEDWMSDMNAGLRKIQENKAKTWLWTTRNQIIETVEKIFTENSTPLAVTARFSNGETHYTKIN
jgi:hypothetical protein